VDLFETTKYPGLVLTASGINLKYFMGINKSVLCQCDLRGINRSKDIFSFIDRRKELLDVWIALNGTNWMIFLISFTNFYPIYSPFLTAYIPSLSY
jgi:hypothetical protein